MESQKTEEKSELTEFSSAKPNDGKKEKRNAFQNNKDISKSAHSSFFMQQIDEVPREETQTYENSPKGHLLKTNLAFKTVDTQEPNSPVKKEHQPEEESK